MKHRECLLFVLFPVSVPVLFYTVLRE